MMAGSAEAQAVIARVRDLYQDEVAYQERLVRRGVERWTRTKRLLDLAMGQSGTHLRRAVRIVREGMDEPLHATHPDPERPNPVTNRGRWHELRRSHRQGKDD
jgi:hypothetical protein